MTVKKVFADYFNFRIIACSLSAACIDAILNSWVYINVRGTCLIAKTANIYTLEIYTLYKWVRVRVRDSSFMHYYASRRSRTRDTVKLTVCVSVCVCVCVFQL